MDKEVFNKLIKENKENLDKKEANKDNRENTINTIKTLLQKACNYQKPDKIEPDDNELFKFSCFVGSWRKYAYYMGNDNHLLVVEKEANESFENLKDCEIKYEELKQHKHEVLELANGYIKTKSSTVFEDVEYSTDTDIYKYVEMAGWLKVEDYNNAVLLRSNEYDRIEIHHLNGDSSDNSVSNLVYIPNTIHCFIHSKK